MEQKINRAILCLYAVGIAQIYALYRVITIALELNSSEYLSGSGLSPFSVFGSGSILAVATLIGIIKVVPELKKQTTTGFLGALLIFFLAVNTWALPACVFGVIFLLDKEVRAPFLEKLDIKI